MVTVAEAFEDPHVKHRGVRQEVSHPRAGPVALVANPIRFSRSAMDAGKAPPLLGEDTEAVLRALGFDERQVRAAQGLEGA